MIATKIENKVLHIQINRPDKKNALTPPMYLAMADAIASAAENDEIRAILICGTNGIFTSGNDVSEFVDSSASSDVNETYQFMQALLHCELPVVAKVEGLAIGIGTTLLLHCDFVLSSNNTKFAMPFINLGLVPEYASSYILPRIAGNLAAAELLMLGEVFSAEEALLHKIVSKVYADDLDEQTSSLLNRLVQKPKLALQQTKKLLKPDVKAIGDYIDLELKYFVAAMQSPQAKEAFSAFLEKRAIDRSIFN